MEVADLAITSATENSQKLEIAEGDFATDALEELELTLEPADVLVSDVLHDLGHQSIVHPTQERGELGRFT